MTFATANTDASFIDFALGRFDLPFELFNPKTGETVAKFDTRTEVDAFLAESEYVQTGERRANEGLPCTMYGEHVPAFEQDFMIIYVQYAEAEKNLTVNEKVHALLEKKGKPARSSSEAKFTKALEQLVADWLAESLASCTNPKYAEFKDTKVVNEIHTHGRTYTGVGLTFDGSGYDSLSESAGYPIESYRNALQALCDLHGWYFEDCTSWAISFYRN